MEFVKMFKAAIDADAKQPGVCVDHGRFGKNLANLLAQVEAVLNSPASTDIIETMKANHAHAIEVMRSSLDSLRRSEGAARSQRDRLANMMGRDKPEVRAIIGNKLSCDLAPPGWYCSRNKGHQGACAGHKVEA